MNAVSPWKLKATGSTAGMIADAAEVRRALELFADSENGCELMALASGISRSLPASDLDGLCRAAGELPGGAGIYFRFNPVPKGLRRPAKDSDILKRRWLFADVDPDKPQEFAGQSATDEEKALVGVVVDEIVEHLSGLGWPAPIITDSGNGHGLFWRCDLPNDDLVKVTVQNWLKGLTKRFTGKAKVDTAVFNAGRLAKLPGTWARKGEDRPDRPHRPCRLVSVPKEIVPLSWEMLGKAAPQPEARKKHPVVAPAVNGHGTTAYGKTALEGVLDDVAKAPVGARNATLFAKAARVGELAAGGEIDPHEAESLLKQVGAAVDPDRPDVADTVERGLKKGAENPKSAPERKKGPRPVFGSKEYAEEVKSGEKSLTVQLGRVKPLAVEWLVPGRVPKRFITVMAGRTSAGKSYVACDLIARLTTGRDIPGAGGECFKPGGALIISEDSPEYVLAPRLIEMGADMGRINAMKWEAMGHYFLGDTEMLEAAVQEVEGEVSVVMIDPPTNFLDDVDEHKNAEVRQLVMKVVEWCFGRDLAVLFILHVNKAAKGVDALNRVMGSVAWVTTSRVAHSVCEDPDEEGRRLWMPIKNNLGPKGKGLAFRIEGPAGGIGKIEWLGEVEMTANDVMQNEGKSRKRAVIAIDWLTDKFRDKLEWASDELFAAGRGENVSKSAIYEAKDILNLPKAKQIVEENGDRKWVWWVPSDWPPLTQKKSSP